MSKHDHKRSHDLASLYALGALNAHDRAAFDQHIETCVSSVREVTALLSVTHRLAAAAPQREAPAAMRARVIQAVTGEAPAVADGAAVAGAPSDDAAHTASQDGTRDAPVGLGTVGREASPSAGDLPLMATADADDVAPTVPGTRRAGRVALWLVTLASLGAAGWIGSQWTMEQEYSQALQENLDAAHAETIAAEEQTIAALLAVDAAREQISLMTAADIQTLHLEGQPAAPEANARWVWSASAAAALFTATGLPEPPPAQGYQLWFISDDAPVSGGMLTVDDSGRMATWVAPLLGDDGSGIPRTAMAVTLEPEAGSESPTGEVYLLGRANSP